jgi:hypothetical protein
LTIDGRQPAAPQSQEMVMTKICELKLNELQAVVGGVEKIIFKPPVVIVVPPIH